MEGREGGASPPAERRLPSSPVSELPKGRSDHRALAYHTLPAYADIGQVAADYAVRLHNGLGGRMGEEMRTGINSTPATFPLSTMFLLPHRMHVRLTLFPDACGETAQAVARVPHVTGLSPSLCTRHCRRRHLAAPWYVQVCLLHLAPPYIRPLPDENSQLQKYCQCFFFFLPSVLCGCCGNRARESSFCVAGLAGKRCTMKPTNCGSENAITMPTTLRVTTPTAMCASLQCQPYPQHSEDCTHTLL